MRILFLCDNFPPEVNAPATRTYEHCKEWVELGYEVTVITCFPNFPKGEVFEGYNNKWKSTEDKDGIKVIRVWSYISANKGFFKRIIDFISYSITAFIAGLSIKTDVIIGTSPQFFTAVSARMLSLFKRKPWIMEVRDIWPESIAAVGAMKKSSLIYKFLTKIERSLYRSATLIIPVTDAFKNYIGSYVRDHNKIRVFKNGVDISKFKPIAKDTNLLNQFALKNKSIIGYLGTHGMAHALDFILDSAKEIANPNVVILLLGDGSEKERLMERARNENINNVVFLPFVSKEEIVQYISIIDIALVNLKKSETFKSVIPSKIFENACMGKPILLGVQGESEDIIRKYNAGIPFEPENRNEFLKSLKEIIRNKETYQKGCYKLAKDYNRSEIAAKMVKTIEQNIKN